MLHLVSGMNFCVSPSLHPHPMHVTTSSSVVWVVDDIQIVDETTVCHSSWSCLCHILCTLMKYRFMMFIRVSTDQEHLSVQ